MKKKFYIYILCFIIFQSCHYIPFTKYFLPSAKTHFPRFSKWDEFKGSVNAYRSCYDITYYDWYVSVNPVEKSINAVMKLQFKVVERQDSIMLDLQRHLKINHIKSSYPLKKWKRKKDVLFLIFNQDLKLNELIEVEISYQGKPVNLLKEGPIQWKRDENDKPWISSQTEAVGPHFMMPCKDLLYDEPDSCSIHVGVPNDLVGVANGKLDSVSINKNEKVYHWSVKNPINVYNISFNVGDFVKIEKDYVDIEGVQRQIQVYALSYNKFKANKYYDQTPLIMNHLEELFGVYPWWNDGCKFVESTFSAMEHQSAIAMGSEYQNNWRDIDIILAHELGHEWWGNNLTAFDYCDMWLHEGFAEYLDALIVERMYGEEDYNQLVRSFTYGTVNKRAVLKPCGVRYNSWVNYKDLDIYSKGAALLHTLRRQLENDDLFFKILKAAQIEFAKSNITADEFIAFFNEKSGRDFSPYFDLYLKEINPPVLEYWFDPENNEAGTLHYRWAKEVPDNFKMKVKISVNDSLISLNPTGVFQEYYLPFKDRVDFDIENFGYIITQEIKPGKR
ncbi:MAG: M1 family metallopeptidase [Bacteroidota bacterium]